MSVEKLHNLFVNLNKVGDIHDFAKVFKEVKDFFFDDPKPNVAQYEIPEILKDLPLADETKIDPQLEDELMDLEPTGSDDTAGELGNYFRRLEIVQVGHENSQIKFFELAPTTYNYTYTLVSVVDTLEQDEDDIFIIQSLQADNIENDVVWDISSDKNDFLAWQIPQEEQLFTNEDQFIEEDAPVIQEDAPVIQEDVPVIQKDAPVIQEDVPVIQKDAPVIQEDAPVIQEDAPVIQEDAPVIQENTPVIQEVTPVIQGIAPSFPLVVLPEAINVVAQEKSKLPYQVVNVHPERGPFQPDTVYLLKGLEPREAPQMNYNHGKTSASMEVLDEQVSIIQPRTAFTISAEQLATQTKIIKEKASMLPAEELHHDDILSTEQQIAVDTFVSEIFENKPKVELSQPVVEVEVPKEVVEVESPKVVVEVEAPKVVVEVETPKVVVEVESPKVDESIETIPQPVRQVFAISAEQFANQAKLIKAKATQLQLTTEQQTEVKTFVTEITEDKTKAEAPKEVVEVEGPKEKTIEPITQPVRQVFAISAEQFANQAKLIKAKTTHPQLTTEQQTQVESFITEISEVPKIVKVTTTPVSELSGQEKVAMDTFVSEIVNDQSSEIKPLLPPRLPPPPPPLSVSKDAIAKKTWAPVETPSVEPTTKAPNVVKPAFAISANVFADKAKQLKHVEISHNEEKHKEKASTNPDGMKSLLLQAMESVARTENKQQEPQSDEDESDDEWAREEREEALVKENTDLISRTVSQKSNSEIFLDKLSSDIIKMVDARSDAIGKVVDVYHIRLNADINAEDAKAVKDKVSTMLEKFETLIHQQLNSHGIKCSKACFQENMAKFLLEEINLKKPLEQSTIENLITQHGHEFEVQMYGKVKFELDTILREESKYLTKAEGLNVDESFSKSAVEQVSKNLITDKNVLKEMVHNLHPELVEPIESKSMETPQLQTTLAKALELRRVGIVEDDDEESTSDWEDEVPEQPSLLSSSDKAEVNDFVKSLVAHKSEELLSGAKALENKKSTTALSMQEAAEVESFLNDITKKGKPLTVADMIQPQDSIPGLQESDVSNTENKQSIGSGVAQDPVAIGDAVMMQQELVLQVAVNHFE